jgi:predicted nucleotidyltransferase
MNSPGFVPSGRFVLRIDPALHGLLRDDAARSGMSLNEYCARRLAAQGAVGPAAEVVRRATALCGDQLTGVVAFGSWARDQLADGSDVDILIVVDGATAITRALYTLWESEPLDWSSRPVQAHFVRLPEPRARISGLWAEAAIEGVVLYDRDLSVARRLVEIRRRIVAGEIVRREIHGQPYWVEAA